VEATREAQVAAVPVSRNGTVLMSWLFWRREIVNSHWQHIKHHVFLLNWSGTVNNDTSNAVSCNWAAMDNALALHSLVAPTEQRMRDIRASLSIWYLRNMIQQVRLEYLQSL
jgi:hypothetical protein